MMILKLKSLFLLASLLLTIANVNQAYSTPVNTPLNTSLSESQFNDLFIASLKNDPNGQQLLSVSDSLNIELYSSHIELSAIINLDKVEQISPEARANVERFDSFFIFLDKNRLNLKVIGEPVTRNGLVGIRDNFSIQFGPIPLSNDTLRQLGLDVAQANTTSLQLEGLHVHDIQLSEGHVDLATSPINN